MYIHIYTYMSSCACMHVISIYLSVFCLSTYLFIHRFNLVLARASLLALQGISIHISIFVLTGEVHRVEESSQVDLDLM